jgi:hypothetical protein
MEATITMAKAAIEAGVSTARDEENLKAEARGRISPLAGLPPHHLAVEACVTNDVPTLGWVEKRPREQ